MMSNNQNTLISSGVSSTSIPNSPKMDRINIIQQKLNYISQSKVKSVKDQNYDRVNRKACDLEKKVTQTLKDIEYKVREYKQSLKQMDRKYTQNKSRAELNRRIRRDQVVQLQRKVYDYLQRQSQARRESENRLLHSFEQKYQQLSLQLAKQIEKRKKYFNELDEDLTNTLPHLNSQAKIELEQWKARFEQLDQSTVNELENFKAQIRQQEQKREKSYQHLMEMMTSVIAEIRSDLNDEKRTREENRNKMKCLFEGACQKLTM